MSGHPGISVCPGHALTHVRVWVIPYSFSYPFSVFPLSPVKGFPMPRGQRLSTVDLSSLLLLPLPRWPVALGIGIFPLSVWLSGAPGPCGPLARHNNVISGKSLVLPLSNRVFCTSVRSPHLVLCLPTHPGYPLHSRRFHPLSQVSAAVRDRVRCVFRCWHYCNTHLLVVRFTGFLHVCVIC